MKSIQRYSFSQNRLNGLWSSQSPPASVSKKLFSIRLRQTLTAKALWKIISEDRILKILFVIIILMSVLALGGLSFVGIGAARSMLK